MDDWKTVDLYNNSNNNNDDNDDNYNDDAVDDDADNNNKIAIHLVSIPSSPFECSIRPGKINRPDDE